MVEYIDHVDNFNKVIGKTTKLESHQLGYPHRVIAIFVFDKNGKLLVNRRVDNGLLDHSVGGHVQAGEKVEIAVQREAFEEIGLPKDTTLSYLGDFFLDECVRGQQIRHWFSLFTVEVKDFKPVIQKEEVIEVIWQNLKDLERQMRQNPKHFSPGFIGTVNFYLSKKDSNFEYISLK